MKTCTKINKCPKITAILDQDLAGDWQYAEGMRKTCQACKEKK